MAQIIDSSDRLNAASVDNDTEFLLSTVRDYTKGLRNAKQKLSESNDQALFFFSGAFAFSSIMAFVDPIRIKMIIGSQVGGAIVAIMFSTGVFILTSMLVLLRKRRKYLTAEVERFTVSLVVLLRRASQIMDRGNVNFSQRVLVDIVLADAEALISDQKKGLFDNKKLGISR